MTPEEFVQKILDDLPTNVTKPEVCFPEQYVHGSEPDDAFLEWYVDSGNLLTIGINGNSNNIYWSYIIGGDTKDPCRSGHMEYNGVLPILDQLARLGFVG